MGVSPLKARAGGKMVLSGAYTVLRGAPALVAAVDRYCTAHFEAPCSFESEEVSAALPRVREMIEQKLNRAIPSDAWVRPDYSADPLRTASEGNGRKLGLGSSSAIVASNVGLLFAEHLPELRESNAALAELTFPIALAAHREAQGGGSGVDVAAACFGGFLRVLRCDDGALDLKPWILPEGVVLEAWAMPESASTKEFVRRAFALEQNDGATFEEVFSAQKSAAEAAVAASDADAFIDALKQQKSALTAWGTAAGIPIVTSEVQSLSRLLPSSGAVLPSGAGGGDITLYAGLEPSSDRFRRAAEDVGCFLTSLSLGAKGLHLLPHS